jgi:hypothetical protein
MLGPIARVLFQPESISHALEKDQNTINMVLALG